MRRAVLLTAFVSACGVPSEEVDALRKDVVRLRGEVREARKEGARAREEVAALNLKAEVHAFLQNDAALKGAGRFPALGDRVRSESRAFTFVLEGGAVRRLSFKMGYRLRVDFVAGSGAADEIGNRLEVFTKNESFSPLNMQSNEYGAYVLEEGQALLLATNEPSQAGGGRKKKKKKKKAALSDASEVRMRYLPAAGKDPRRVAFVRVTFLGPVGDEAESEGGDDEGGGEDEDEGDDEDEGEGDDEDAGDGDGGQDGGYDFSDDD